VDNTDLILRPLEQAHAHEIIGWHYEPPYDLYDLDQGDPGEIVESLLDPACAYHAILTPEGELVAFCCFGEDGQVPGGNYSAEALDLGLGVRPDLTGQGQSHVYIQAVLAYARLKYAPHSYRVTIAAFNTRAQRAWTKAGFRPVQRFESTHSRQPFVILVYGI
jgi:ribosomal-protein-alanine N-acetyltransferase